MSRLKVLFTLVSSMGLAVAADTTPAGTAPVQTNAVAVFISQRMFLDEALQVVTRRLEARGYRPVLVARDTGLAIGMDQTVVRPGLMLGECRSENFAALIIINGSGIATYWQDTVIHAKCREFAAAGRVIGGIGIATICLARAGVLRGHKATILPDRHAVRELLVGGARYWPNPVVTDRNIVTAADSQHIRRFMDVLVRLLDTRNRSRQDTGRLTSGAGHW
ncbi:MAG: DJ-1/PfpI family protein [candidate division WOR-3 bacterium]